MSGHVSILREPGSDVLRITGVGMWQPESARRHFTDIEDMIAALRTEGLSSRILMDLQQAPVQSAATGQIIVNGLARLNQLAEKIAIVCETAMLALQMKRSLPAPNIATFHTMQSARAWLTEPPGDGENHSGW